MTDRTRTGGTTLGRLVAAAALCLCLASATHGQRRNVELGDPAPGLEVEAWVLGEQLTIEDGVVYVVLFWESASAGGHTGGETLKALERLEELLALYGSRGMAVLVIAPENAERIAETLKRRPQKIGFTLAADRRGNTQRAWVDRSGTTELPAAFIVGRDRRIMHIGNPRDADFEGILLRVLRGRYDPKLQERAKPVIEAARRARKVKNWRMAERQYDQVIEIDPIVFAEVAIERFEMMLAEDEKNDPEGAYAYATQLVETHFKSDADALRRMAALVLTDPEIADGTRNVKFADKLAKQALRLTGRKDPESLATMALVEYHKGNLLEAVGLQRDAYFVAHPQLKPRYKRVLDGWKAESRRR